MSTCLELVEAAEKQQNNEIMQQAILGWRREGLSWAEIKDKAKVMDVNQPNK